MPIRALPDGTYQLKPPRRNLFVIISKPGGAVLYTGKAGLTPVTLSVAVTAGHYARLKVWQ